MPEMPPRYRPVTAGLSSVPINAGSRSSAERRASSAQRGYDWKWMHTARAYRRDHPLCVCCEANDRTAAAEVVDHIVPHRGNERLFWDPRNWQSLCHWCHNNIKAALERQFDLGEIGEDKLRLGRRMPEWFGIDAPK